ncbi:ABC transporter ATP-binding protein [Corticimicrobacter populi]|uniref:ABC transporter ATP-binding protein n=1 Tax=Corticimicrobacter populi TaxID=2175229 RepID=A0A2V1JWM4_9BURK|nr:ABC transporter ATP-binding protein [Corticimicrobacter populi]PWF22642.1 ABC transporter ATP-binding protein [Corticimicrobacter populi]
MNHAPLAHATAHLHPTPAIRLRQVSKSWGEQVVIPGLDLDIPRGGLTALLGPSGCGKSTLLRLIAGLEHPDSGSVEIDGHDVTAAPPAQRGLSMVFQSYALFPHLSVAENIVFGLKVRSLARGEREHRLQEALRLTNLAGLEQRKPAQLSGGQRQRVALARSIVSGHSLCLMDEPLSNLDAKLRHSVRHEIRSLQQRLGMTVVYVTHDQTEALGMADTVVLLDQGRIAQQGAPAELYNQPRNTFCATFIGTPPMMLLDSSYVPAELLPHHDGSTTGGPLRIGVRPEHLLLGDVAAGRIPVILRHREFQGAEAYAYLELPDASQIIARIAHGLPALPGARLGLSWHTVHAHYFAPDSGRRLDLPHTGTADHQAQPHTTQDDFRPVAQYA